MPLLYDPLTARWNGVDVLAEQYSSFSTYGYVGGNPILNIDPDGMRNMVYVVFLQSAGLSTMQKKAVIAEMQRIYNDVIGLRNGCGDAMIQVTEFDQTKRGNIYGEYLDASDVVVGIGSVSAVNALNDRCGSTCAQIDENKRLFIENGSTNPELSENLRNLYDPNGQNRGRFVGIASGRAKIFAGDVNTSLVNTIAYLGVHGSGHNVNMDHAPGPSNNYFGDSHYPMPYYCIMADGRNIYNEISGTTQNISLWLTTKENNQLKPYFMEKFRADTPQDNYDYNRKHNITRPIKQ